MADCLSASADLKTLALRLLLLLPAILFLLSADLSAQSTSSAISGVVTDQYGARVAGARITIYSAEGVRREVLTDDDGQYEVTSIAPGDYTLVAEGSGLLAAEQTLTIGAGSHEIRLTLLPAGLSESVTVNGNAERGIETTFKLPGSLKETPRSVTIVNSERIREQNFRQVPDALAYVPGMSVNSYRAGGYHFYARGYRMSPDDTRTDGFAGVNIGGGFGASLFGVEEAVLLRGPASLLYGSTASPGGLINLVTKKPQVARATRIDLRGGSYVGGGVGLTERGFGGIDFDSTGKLGESDRVLYRALFTIENMNYFTNDVLDRNRYASLSFTLRLDSEGRYTLTPVARWTRLNRPAGGGIVASPSTSLTTNDGKSEVIVTDLSPSDVNLFAGGRVDETLLGGFDFSGALTPALNLNASFRTIALDARVDQFAPQVNTAAQRLALVSSNTLERVRSKSETEQRYHSFDVNATYEIRSAGWWRNMTQVGAHARVAGVRTSAAPAGFTARPQSAINIYTGERRAPLISNYPALVRGAQIDTTYWNTYLQNRTTLANNRVVVTLGLGYGQTHPDAQRVRRSDLLPNLGVVFNATDSLALYASYATSFNPTDPAAEDASGRQGAFDPTVGSNYEVGAKYDLPLRRTFLTFALFRNQVDDALVQSGTLDLNPNGNRYYVAAGTRRSSGAELTAESNVVREWRVSGAVSFLDAIYTGEAPASAAATAPLPGSRAEKSPRWSYNLWNRYDFSSGRLRNLGAGLGVIYQSARLGGNGARTPTAPDPLLLPAFTRFDAALFYRLNDKVDFSVNVENLFDELIFVNGSVGSALEIVAPRTFTVRTSYRF